jgi:hypothetical protein
MSSVPKQIITAISVISSFSKCCWRKSNFCYALFFVGPPLWSSGQSSWLQIQWSGFDSRGQEIFWDVVGLEQGPLSLVSTVEKLIGRNSSGSGLEIRKYDRGDPLSWPRDTLYSQTLALISPTRGGRSAGIVRSRTKATELLLLLLFVVCSSAVVWVPSYRSVNHKGQITAELIDLFRQSTSGIEVAKVLHYLRASLSASVLHYSWALYNEQSTAVMSLLCVTVLMGFHTHAQCNLRASYHWSITETSGALPHSL